MDKNLSVTILQLNLAWEDIDKNLQYFSERIHSLRSDTDIIILPEMFSTGFSMNPSKLAEPPTGKTFNWMKTMAEKTEAVIVGSYIVAEEGDFFNRLIWMFPDGSHQSYNKKHLFSLSEEPMLYKAGKHKILVTYKGWKILPLICYDLRFPVWSRNTSNYDLLIYVANWPEKRANHWRALLQARAIENQVYTIGVNRVGTDGRGAYHSGDSTVFDYAGNVLNHAAHTEQANQLTLDYDSQQEFRKVFPFLVDQG